MTRNKWRTDYGEIAPDWRESDIKHLAFGAGFERLNQAWVIIPDASLIDPLRYRLHAQKDIRRGPQELDTGLSG